MKEWIKTFALIILVLGSLVLSTRIWLDEKLWPQGYNFFSVIQEAPLIGDFLARWRSGPVKEPSPPKEALSKPERIVVNTDYKRAVYYNSDETFETIYRPVKNLFNEFLCNAASIKSHSVVPVSEWQNAMSQKKSIYVSYSIAYNMQLFSQITLGLNEVSISSDIFDIKEFALVANDDSGALAMLIPDYKSNQIYKYILTIGNRGAVEQTADMIVSEFGKENYEFSYENKFDVPINTGLIDPSAAGEQGGAPQRLIAPMVLLTSNTVRNQALSSRVPISDFSREEPVLERLLTNFGYDADSMRRYTDRNQTLIYVENNGTLKLHSNGLIEYRAVGERGGIPITQHKTSLYESLNAAIEFAERVWYSAVPDKSFNVVVTSNLLDNNAAPGHYTFYLDYFVEGVPVNIDILSENNAFEQMRHAIVIEMDNGLVKRYRHYLREFIGIGKTHENTSLISSLDGIFSRLNTEKQEIYINDIKLAYLDDGKSDELITKWTVSIDGVDGVIRY